ncbi:hypothetical protein EPO33_00095 [Patescibacteria group bacterium]|nr:MAG: hypothetical protein EPO33_00095 [Patescibacteria group bacterium]
MLIRFDHPGMNGEQLLRKAGYGELRDRRASERSWFKRFGSEFYPRFHAYVEETSTGFTVKLHLDQKKPSYEGFSAHSGEYEGPAVEREAQRLREVADKAGSVPPEEDKPKGWFGRLFGS